MLALAACGTAGCDLPGKPDPAERYKRPGEISSFKTLFQQNCVACHGTDGKMGPAPPLNDPLFLALVPDEELLQVISEGRHGTPMPAFAMAQGGELRAEQVAILAGGLKSHWSKSGSAPKGTPEYRQGAIKAGTREQGVAVFARACSSCHGANGQGGDSAGAINDPDFLALISDQALRRLVITGRPDLGMPNYADPMGRPGGFKPLTSQEVADVVALLAHWRQSGSVGGKEK